MLVEFAGNHRASADPEFAALLARVRVGKPTSADIALLRTRVSHTINPATLAKMLEAGAPCLLPTRAQVAKENKRCLQELIDADTSLAIIECPAEDTYAKDSKPSPPDNAYLRPEDTGGLESLLELVVGARVMLRMNLDIPDGLVNGATGWIQQLDFHPDGIIVVGVWVRFDDGGK
eukprot:13162707-Heterocapsa_arctica.AAC.1